MSNTINVMLIADSNLKMLQMKSGGELQLGMGCQTYLPYQGEIITRFMIQDFPG